jgi:hypothetical protein
MREDLSARIVTPSARAIGERLQNPTESTATLPSRKPLADFGTLAMPRNTSSPSGRELFGNAHSRNKSVGAGKGDKPRHVFDESWRSNYDGIDWSGSVSGFNVHPKKSNTQIKKYG